MSQKELSRRSFLKGTAAAFAGLAFTGMAVTEKARHASPKWQPKLTKVFPKELYENEKGDQEDDHSSDQ